MSDAILPKLCERRECSGEAVIRRGGHWLCVIHYRIGQMADCAREKGKRVPSPAEFVSMVADLLKRGMRCEHCGDVMCWRGLLDQETWAKVVTLQHDASGNIRLLCMGCNRRHASFPGDTFYDYPLDWQFCPKCLTPKHESAFYRQRNGKRKSYCRDCKHTIAKSEWAAIKEKRA